MPAPRFFSDADRESGLVILKRYDGVISRRCLVEVRDKIGKYISDKTLRKWWIEANAPKRSHHKKPPENTADFAPLFDEVDGVIEYSSERPDYSQLDRAERVELLLDLLINRALQAEQIEALNGRNLHTTIQGYLEKLAQLRGLDENLLKVVPMIKELIAACQQHGLDPELTIADLADYLRIKAPAPVLTNGELIELPDPTIERR